MQTGSILVIIGYLVIAGGLLIGSLIVHYGNKLNQQVSEKTILDQQKKSEGAIRNDIGTLKIEIANLRQDKERELKSEFPNGYQLFGIINNQIIPHGQPTSDEIKISWSTAKILEVTKERIKIMLPDAILPGNNILQGNVVGVKNMEGITSSGHITIGGYTSFIKILKSDKNRIIAAVGYIKKNPNKTVQ